MKAAIKKFKKAIVQGELSTVKSVLEKRAIDEQRLIFQAITLDNLESLKHNDAHPSWEHAGFVGGNQLPPNEQNYQYIWDMDDQGNEFPQSATNAHQNHQMLKAAVVEAVTHYLEEKPLRSKDDLYEIAPPTSAHQNYSMFVKSNPTDANAKKMDASSTRMKF